MFGSRVDNWIRLLLLALFALPLGLSASYKTFVGGSSSISVPSTSGFFGYIYRPGYQRVGFEGMALMVDVYLPFWLDPQANRTYGFNLFVESNKTAAVLDAPWPLYLTQLQSRLKAGESLNLITTVNATVADQINISSEQRANDTWWNTWVSTLETNITQQGGPYGLWVGYLAGCDACRNWTTQFFSSWDTSKNQTFQDQAVRVQLSRRLYQGTWNITSTNILLITVTASNLQQFYSSTVTEFNWAWRNSLSGWVPPSYKLFNQTFGYFPHVNLVPALAAAITWSRMVGEDGAEKYWSYDGSSPLDYTNDTLGYAPAYWKESSEVSTVKSAVTLQRHLVLALILAIYPLLTAFSLVGKVLLYFVPIGEGFNTISLMAGIERGTLDILHGASLTGKLGRDVKVQFITTQSKHINERQLSLRLDSLDGDSAERNHRLEVGKIYG